MKHNKKVTIDDLKELTGSFSWNYCQDFFIETSLGNFIYSDPEYNGTGIIKAYLGEYERWCKECGIPFARDKGTHLIGDYCNEMTSLEYPKELRYLKF